MSKVVKITFFLLVVVTCSIGLTFYLHTLRQPSLNDYYAVFLSNGQVYFGHLSNQDEKTLTLTGVFYLRANPSLQNNAKENSLQSTQGNIDLSLIKLGNEIHGPTDTLYIVTSQVLFWEKLRTDSRIVKAINQYPK